MLCRFWTGATRISSPPSTRWSTTRTASRALAVTPPRCACSALSTRSCWRHVRRSSSFSVSPPAFSGRPLMRSLVRRRFAARDTEEYGGPACGGGLHHGGSEERHACPAGACYCFHGQLAAPLVAPPQRPDHLLRRQLLRVHNSCCAGAWSTAWRSSPHPRRRSASQSPSVCLRRVAP